MAPKRKHVTTSKARSGIVSGTVAREDSDDELGLEDHPWEFIYAKDDTAKVVGARMGRFECYIGDTVLLKAPAGNEAWVAMLWSFSEGEIEDEDGDMVVAKKAGMIWFSSPKEIRGKSKLSSTLTNELYITANFDENPLTTINGKARLVSPKRYLSKYPNGVVPRSSKDYEEFVWEDVYTGSQDMGRLVKMVEDQTIKTRKRKAHADLHEKNAAGEPSTPSKRRKTTDPTPTPSKVMQNTPRVLVTPSHKRIMTKKPLEFTPLGTRLLDVTAQTASPHQLARSTLHVSAVPHALPCRETEFDQVYSHLEAAITAGTGSCIYISGTPGTGKTATVREVVASLQASVADEQLDDFYFVEINGMKIVEPNQSYAMLWEALQGDRVSPSHALELLEQEFTTPSPRRVPCVVLMDELDQLVTRNQGVMYNFFNWPQLRHSRLIVLAVANTMDLPERTLSNKISSRLGLTRITFPGYTYTQLMSIIQSRLEGIGHVVVESDAVQFASRKVAAVSGDARRALDICRRAVEIAEQDVFDQKENAAPDTPSKTGLLKSTQGTVTIATVKRAINEATSTPLTAALRSLPLVCKLFLAALLARNRRSGLTEAVIGDVVDEARRLSLMTQTKAIEECLLASDYQLMTTDHKPNAPGKRGKPQVKPDLDKAARVRCLGLAAVSLAESGIVVLEMRHGDRVGRIRLAVQDEDIRLALRDDEQCLGLGLNA
ncbi:hypothetical protein AMS68_007531 [Peltaster fructicola]|uniref:Origin recognition complex subunit 1 n=1 Tax=Peltaster fructicola TaxID=286661 RepID=A0A6H0Y4S6_9PEZI|nr:hypothetical protein AMS68_007531 [Peltaster fructicola]